MEKVILRTKFFEKALKKFNPKIQQKFAQKLDIFLGNEKDERLKTHQLKGYRKNEFAFSVTGNVRAIYRKRISNGEEIIAFVFVDIGNHNNVY